MPKLDRLQREVELRCFGRVRAGPASELLDAPEPLMDGVAVEMQSLGDGGRGAGAVKPAGQRPEKSLGLVVGQFKYRAEHPAREVARPFGCASEQ